jgi:hypothetical protein
MYHQNCAAVWEASSSVATKLMDTMTLPDFIESIETKHPGVEVEYSALKALVRHLLAHRESDDFKHAVMLQSGIAWQHYNAILVLLAHGFGIQGLVLCRTLFEVVVGTLHLIKNPNLLADFTDHAKLQFYEQCLASGFLTHELAKIAPECEAIKARQKGKRRSSWHGSTIRRVAIAVGFGETYDLLYPDAFWCNPCRRDQDLEPRLAGVDVQSPKFPQ